MTRMLVTGFPGWLTEALLQSLQTGPLPGLDRVRCLVQAGSPASRDDFRARFRGDYEFVSGDLRDEASLRKAVEGCEFVFHSAGILHVRRTRDWYDVNAGGTRRLVAAAAAAGVTRFVYISTNAAAGRSSAPDRPMVESDPARPISHYGRSKRLGEELTLAAGDRIEPVVLRPCMFYGPPVPARHVDVYNRILTGRMPVVGTGRYARSLSYIDNLVQGCRLALTHPRAVGQVYYIADEPVYTTGAVVEAMAEALGVPLRRLWLPAWSATLALGMDLALARTGLYWQSLHLVGEGNWHVGVSCRKAMDELGYRPGVALREGMRRAVAWCRERKLLVDAH